MNLEYKDYVAGPIDFGADDGTLSGIRDVVHFKGKTADELRQAFRNSIDFYLASCEEHPPRGGFSHAVSVRARRGERTRGLMKSGSTAGKEGGSLGTIHGT